MTPVERNVRIHCYFCKSFHKNNLSPQEILFLKHPQLQRTFYALCYFWTWKILNFSRWFTTVAWVDQKLINLFFRILYSWVEFILHLLTVAVHKGDRSVWTFTLRDSEMDFINVTVWGNTEFITKIASTYNIGSVGT